MSLAFKYIHQFIFQGIQGHEIELVKCKSYEVPNMKIYIIFAENFNIYFREEKGKENDSFFLNIRIHSVKCGITSHYNLNNILSGIQSCLSRL